MNTNIEKVNSYADKLRKTGKSSFLDNVFKKGLLRRLNGISTGYIKVFDGDEIYEFGDSNHDLTVVVTVHSTEFYTLVGTGGALGAAEAFIAGYWDADDLVNLNRIMIKNLSIMEGLEKGIARIFSPINKLIHSKRQNTISGSKSNIVAHYDLSNEFYKLWLDETLTYSCGYFINDDSTMKEASIEKNDRLCRKLKLGPSDHLLEIGSGWGGFSTYAAEKYGCQITTTTISDAQYEYVKALINKKGLGSKITLLKEDYRHLNGTFDKIVSIEMIEAVGYQYIPTYFQNVSKLLKPDGLFALQGITYNDQGFDEYKKSVDFIKKYIFPGSCLISVSQVNETIKKLTDLSIVHLEDITMHYARTLRIWRENFIKVMETIKNLGFSDEFIRMWIFYFVYCEAGFIERHIGDYQFVFAKSGARNIRIEY